MQSALEQILSILEKLYMETISSNNSRYAKKRIKIDIKRLLVGVDNDETLRFSRVFKQLHFNLLVQEDPSKLDQMSNSTESSETSEADLSKITVMDPYSKIKKSVKNILINRCSLKFEDLSQFC